MEDDSDLTSAIDAAQNIAQVGRACRGVATALGFQHFLYGFRAPLTLLRPCQFILSGYPKAWRERYDQERYLAIDPVLSRALASVVPYAWDELERTDARVARLFEEAAGFGLAHGFSVPVHGAHGEGAVMSFARPAPELPAAGASRLRLFQRAQWFTARIHQKLRDVVFGASAEPAGAQRLTPRERDCLRLAAEGMSASRIGRDMNITERTVVFHLNRAEEKLGASRRQQAVARAVALGQIEPGCYPVRFNESETLIEYLH